MEQLSGYLLSQKTRSIASVGGGNKAQFNTRPDIQRLDEAERIARWMMFQESEFGYDFLSSTLPAELTVEILDRQSLFQRVNKEHAEIPKFIEENEKIKPYMESISIFHKFSKKPIGHGFFGPFTLAGGLKGIKDLFLQMERQSDVVKEKLSTITEILCNIAISFEANGADFLWIAEPTGVLVSPSYFRKFITPYLQQIFDRVSIPGFLHMPGDTNHLLGEMMTVGAQCLSLDSMVNFRELAYRLPPDICIRGNINSKALLYESKNEIIQKVSSLNRSIKNFPQFIIGSGGGLAAETPELNIKAIQEETDKHAWYTNKQYQEIDTLWKILAQADRLETVVSIKKYGENTSILLNAFEEACNFLNYQFKNRKIDEKFYIQRLEYMAKLLEHIHFTSTDTIEIDNTTINLVQFQEATLKTFFRDT